MGDLISRVAVAALEWQRLVSPDIHDIQRSVAASRFALLWSLNPGETKPSERGAAHTVAPVLLWHQIMAPDHTPFPRQNAELHHADIQAALIRRRASGNQP